MDEEQKLYEVEWEKHRNRQDEEKEDCDPNDLEDVLINLRDVPKEQASNVQCRWPNCQIAGLKNKGAWSFCKPHKRKVYGHEGLYAQCEAEDAPEI